MKYRNTSRETSVVGCERKPSVEFRYRDSASYSMEVEPQVVRLPEVQRLTGLSRSTVYAKMDIHSPYFDADWPKKVSLGPRSVGWYRHEVIEWVQSRVSSNAWGVQS